MEICNLRGEIFFRNADERTVVDSCSNYAARLPGHSILVLKRTEDCVNTASQGSRRCFNNATCRVFYNLNIV